MIKFLGLIAGIYILIVIGMTLYQRKLMYYPHTDLLAPEQYGLQGFAAETIKSEDGVQITYWYAAPQTGKPTILYLHGNAGHLGFRSAFDHHAREQGYGVLALSYRGFGLSHGSPSEQGFYADARAALKELNGRYHTEDKDIILYGESIGTGVAIELARKRDFRFIALQAPFTSASAKAAEIYYWLPVKWVMWDVFDSLSKAPEIISPVLVMIGEEDHLIHPADSVKLYEAIPTPKKLVRFPGIGHNDFHPLDTLKAVSDFDSDQR